MGSSSTGESLTQSLSNEKTHIERVESLIATKHDRVFKHAIALVIHFLYVSKIDMNIVSFMYKLTQMAPSAACSNVSVFEDVNIVPCISHNPLNANQQ